MISPKMNTGQMSCFLLQISTAHPDDFIIMVLDGASSHKSKDLQKPENIHFIPLPSYSPELNPQEHVWDELREKEFPNRVFNTFLGFLSNPLINGHLERFSFARFLQLIGGEAMYSWLCCPLRLLRR